MGTQFLIDRSELSKLIQLEISKTSTQEVRETDDRCDIGEASRITHLSRSHIYKLTGEKLIPFARFQGRLIFSRRDLKLWMDSKTIPVLNTDKP